MFEQISSTAIDPPSFLLGMLLASAIAATAILVYVAVRASKRTSRVIKDFTRVTAATDAFYGLIKHCEILEDIVRAQAEGAGKDIVLPVTSALSAVRQTISDPPWLDLTCGHKNGPAHTSNH